MLVTDLSSVLHGVRDKYETITGLRCCANLVSPWPPLLREPPSHGHTYPRAEGVAQSHARCGLSRPHVAEGPPHMAQHVREGMPMLRIGAKWRNSIPQRVCRSSARPRQVLQHWITSCNISGLGAHAALSSKSMERQISSQNQLSAIPA